jgi:hypothetical protein
MSEGVPRGGARKKIREAVCNAVAGGSAGNRTSLPRAHWSSFSGGADSIYFRCGLWAGYSNYVTCPLEQWMQL